MSDSRVAAGLDRLPWLSDEPAPKAIQARQRRRDLTGWAGAAMLVVAGVSFWLGSRSQTEDMPPPRTATAPSASVSLPPPLSPPQQTVRIEPQREIAPAHAPEVRLSPAPQVRIAPVPRKVETADVVKQVSAQNDSAPLASEPPVKQAPPLSAAPKAAASSELTAWPPRVTAGAYGRLVQIGAYGSPPQAKHGWTAMVRAYPAVAHLRAVVVETRNSKGRLFYRFQIGTTSQAHSEVLCQRMQKIELSCAVVGLPWKAKVER
jgi:SPOR domain